MLEQTIIPDVTECSRQEWSKALEVPGASAGAAQVHKKRTWKKKQASDQRSDTVENDKRNVVTIEYINDSGAGRTIFSEKSLTVQGVPKSAIKPFLQPASEALCFDTGGGEKDSSLSLGFLVHAFGKIRGFPTPRGATCRLE